jgi:hypothetical protein
LGTQLQATIGTFPLVILHEAQLDFDLAADE